MRMFLASAEASNSSVPSPGILACDRPGGWSAERTQKSAFGCIGHVQGFAFSISTKPAALGSLQQAVFVLFSWQKQLGPADCEAQYLSLKRAGEMKISQESIQSGELFLCMQKVSFRRKIACLGINMYGVEITAQI